MVEEKMMRLSQVTRRLNVGLSTITEYLASKGFEVENKPNAKIPLEQFNMLAKEFASSAMEKEEASGRTIGVRNSDNVVIDSSKNKQKDQDEEELFIKGLSTSEEEAKKPAAKEEPKKEKEEPEKISNRLQGIKVVGKVDLDELKGKKKSAAKPKSEEKPEPQKPETPSTSKAEPQKTDAAAEEKSKPSATEKPKAEEKKEKPVQPAAKDEKEEAAPKEQKKAPTEAKKEESPKEEEQKPAAKQEQKDKSEPRKVEPQKTEAQKAEPQKQQTKPAAEKKEEKPAEKEKDERIGTRADQLKGLTVVGKIDLPEERKKKAKPVASSDEGGKKKRKRRRRIKNQEGEKQTSPASRGASGRGGDKKGRGGKTVTTCSGKPFENLSPEALEALLKELKTTLGTGGARKGAQLELQGDVRETLADNLRRQGYVVVFSGG